MRTRFPLDTDDAISHLLYKMVTNARNYNHSTPFDGYIRQWVRFNYSNYLQSRQPIMRCGKTRPKTYSIQAFGKEDLEYDIEAKDQYEAFEYESAREIRAKIKQADHHELVDLLASGVAPIEIAKQRGISRMGVGYIRKVLFQKVKKDILNLECA